MKKILLLLPMVLVLLVSGCTTQDPEEIVRESTEKLEALESYNASYTLSLTMYGFTLEGEMVIYNKGEKTRIDTIINAMGEGTVTSSYTLPSGTYTCVEAAGNVTCIKGEAQALMSPGDSVAFDTELVERGIIMLKFNNIATVAGRNCYNITSDFDISKLDELDSGDLAGLGMEQEMLSSLEAFTQFDIISCYDFETGMPLAMSMLFELDMSKLPQQAEVIIPGKVSMVIEMTATNFVPNATIGDSMFELPVEPTDLSELQEQEPLQTPESCTNPGTGRIMNYTEALEIASTSSCTLNGSIIEGTESCNSDTGTWWFDLDLEREGCSPACVVSVEYATASINWRCTGVIPE